MALRCGLNTWSVHAVLEHAACTPRPVYHACTPGSVHATLVHTRPCTRDQLQQRELSTSRPMTMRNSINRQSVKFIYTRSVYRQQVVTPGTRRQCVHHDLYTRLHAACTLGSVHVACTLGTFRTRGLYTTTCIPRLYTRLCTRDLSAHTTLYQGSVAAA